MSHGVDVEEFLQGFLAEADENLARITSGLAAIEAAPDRSHARELGEVLRALHTLKGIAGMMGIDPIVELAHAMETRLREVSRAEGRVPSTSLDALLAGTRAIAQRVHAVGERATVPPPPESVMADLAKLDGGSAVHGPAPTISLGPLEHAIEEKLTASDRAELVEAHGRGELVISLRFAPSPERASAGLSITSVRAGIESVGRIIRVVPRSVPRDGDAPGGLDFIIMLATSASLDDVADAVKLPKSDLSQIAFVDAQSDDSLAESSDEMDDPLDRASRKGAVRVDVARLDAAVELLAAVTNGRARLREEVLRLAEVGVDVRPLRVRLDDEARVLRRLRTALVDLRMVPLRDVIEPLRLVVRGLRASAGKAVRLVIDVGNVELDKSVAERILPALIHLVRNAVDHGIEEPALRRASTKAAEGLVTVRAWSSSTTHLDIEIEDDGRGIDLARVAERSRRPVPRTAAELLDILTTAGFSTRAAVSTTSGRGVGLDIVRRTVEQLGGALDLEHTPGRGTTWRMRVPLTVAMIDAFACETGSQRYLVPVAAVDSIIDVADATVVAPPDGHTHATSVGMISTRGVVFPILSLGQILGVRTPTDEGKALLVQIGSQPCAFSVSRMLGRHEVIVRPLADPLVSVLGVSGSADLGDGQPTLVLDLRVLGAAATRRAEVVHA